MPQYVGREDYYAAAIAILSGSGAHELTMTALHRGLGVSSGSFYNWFRNWPDFVERFLEHWRGSTEAIAREAAGPHDPHERLELLRRLSRTVPHDAEAAIRVWATTDPAVAEAQRAVDARRLEVIRRAVAAAGAPDAADELAELCLSAVVGAQLRHRPVDVEGLDRVLARFIALVEAHSGRPD
ncbi:MULTISPECIES: TetR/AcrR family transcriptional regulator [unclassified Pseudonocardia]|uniref:TetR/AcrR family transcriptional regulator n=1 Tax=unclassified Pseudonocardia TaxID=2619320 RepID=UPI00094B28D8|nr:MULTISPECIES: TetR/AcrR family transcriptional regulator [unclassified Pseudonocardia]OLM32885.1 Transcriptional regulator, TetR family [Pseudonocardia sp. Ae717_Ps2]